ncbi:hypothetical protein ACI5KX_14295 [Erythrobacter sp. GH1-10]|uniref:hypothetical protein n=1 Tax=Erythrobacter sp. GH1-10 TaxID=3349334 RepID=UPI003877D410
MARQFTRSYTHDHVVNADGTVDFQCSTDRKEWPWLALGPHHPITVQAQNFWTSVGAILALGGMEEGQWSALTWTDWICGAPGVGDGVRGHYKREESGETERYVITLFDEASREIVRMRGRGVVFRNRDFEKWRSKAKRAARANAPDPAFEYVGREVLGIGPGEHPVIGAIQASDTPFVDALITPENGLPPANRVLSGSGDHVNSVHIIEAARQALCLFRGNPAMTIAGGEMELNRYVELGTPFRLYLETDGPGDYRLRLDQMDRPCANIVMRLG